MIEWFESEDCKPEDEDYSEPFTISGQNPESGPIVEFREDRPEPDESPICKITVRRGDGSEYVEFC